MQPFLLVILVLVTSVGSVRGNACNTSVTEEVDKIFSISSPDATTYKSPCHVTIVPPNPKTPVAMYFTVGMMTLGGNDTLEVYNGVPAENKTAMVTFNQTLSDLDNTFVIFYSSGVSNVTFVWNSTAPSNSSWEINVTPKDCNYTFNTTSSVVLSSPVYETSTGIVDCTYHVNYMTDGKTLVLGFDEVNLLKGQLIVSGQAYGDNTTSIPDQVLPENHVTLSFRLPADREGNSFTAVGTGVSTDCTETITLTNTSLVELTSPNYPAYYGNNLRCRWIINSPARTKLWFSVEDFVMGDNVDNLIMRDGNSHASQVLGDFNNLRKPDYSLLTSGNASWMQFETDESRVSDGFRIVFRAIKYGGLYRDEGHIVLNATKPTLPIDHKDIDNLVYFHLMTEPDSQILVNFSVPKDVRLHHGSISCYEGLVYDPSKAIANFTREIMFYEVFTRGPAMLIVLDGFLHNNTYVANQSLTIDFRSKVQDGTLQYSLGKLGSYTLTKQQVRTMAHKATWLIYGQTGTVTSLKFSTLEVLPGLAVDVYSRQGAPWFPEATFVASVASPPVMYLPKGARVVYELASGYMKTPANNNADDLPVLVASYENIPACGESFSSRSGVITSPMYPDRYPYNADCMWKIGIPSNKSLHLAFTDFKLAADHSLSVIAVTVITNTTTNTTKNITKTIGKFGSQSVPTDIITSGIEVWVNFSSVSMDYNVSTGFKIDFEIIDCGGNLTSSGQTINTPGFPNVVKGNTTCVWIITLPTPSKKGDKNSVNVIYTVKGRTANETASLEIRDGNSSQSESLDIPGKDVQSGKLMSRSNQLYVAYRLQGPEPNKTSGFAFQMEFKSFECNQTMQCGNGICIHPKWRCNGIDECGDMTDERNCGAPPAPGPTTIVHTGIKPWAIAVAVLLTFFAAVLLTIFVPRLYYRCKNRRYGTLMSPVET